MAFSHSHLFLYPDINKKNSELKCVLRCVSAQAQEKEMRLDFNATTPLSIPDERNVTRSAFVSMSNVRYYDYVLWSIVLVVFRQTKNRFPIIVLKFKFNFIFNNLSHSTCSSNKDDFL